uniref:Uncharacterized protein n=1 Tax=Anguilla anguilla TaxID=7936 RepID=A0A0E9QBA7_ANGAN
MTMSNGNDIGCWNCAASAGIVLQVYSRKGNIATTIPEMNSFHDIPARLSYSVLL